MKLSGFDHSVLGAPHEEQKVSPRKLTPYDPTEVAEGHAGSAQDLWNLGVVFFEILFGYLPFGDDPKSEEYEKNRNVAKFEWP